MNNIERIDQTQKPNSKPQYYQLGKPRKNKHSGFYNLRIVSAVEMEDGYSYQLEDGDGYIYDVISKHRHPIGRVVACNLSITCIKKPEDEIVIKIESILRKQKSGKKRAYIHNKYGNKPKNRTNENDSQDSWLPIPAKGDRFRLIYTPMK